MPTSPALKTGLVGYLYRWVRNAGILALLSGTALISNAAFRHAGDLHTVATVSHLEIACELVGASIFSSAVVRDVECSNAAAIRSANAHMPLNSREVTYARLDYQTASGASLSARIRAEALGRPDIQRGDILTVAYRAADENEVRPVTTLASLSGALALFAAGLFAMMIVMFARRAASFQSDVALEVADLKRGYEARSQTARQAGQHRR